MMWSDPILDVQVEDLGGQIQQNGGIPHNQGQDSKPRQVTSVQVRQPNLYMLYFRGVRIAILSYFTFSEVIARVCKGETEPSS